DFDPLCGAHTPLVRSVSRTRGPLGRIGGSCADDGRPNVRLFGVNLTRNALPIALEVQVTWTGRRLHVQVTSPKRTSGPRRYAVVSTPTCDLNRTGCSSGITCETAIFPQPCASSNAHDISSLAREEMSRGYTKSPCHWTATADR